MNYPQELIDEVKKRSAGMRLEGINSGSGPKHPKLMIIGEAPGRNEIVNNIPFSGDAGKELNKSLEVYKCYKNKYMSKQETEETA